MAMSAGDVETTLAAARHTALDAIAGASSPDDLDHVEREHLGKASTLATVKRRIKDLEPEVRPRVGRALTEHRAVVEKHLAARRAALTDANRETADRIDVTLGGHGRRRGHLHLITQVQRDLEDIFCGMGYRVVEGPEVEDDWHNFEALNIPAAHPARSMQDTLYVERGGDEEVMLRTHTSPMQVRTMESTPPPIFVVAPGRAYRNETLDARHSPVFHQLECLAVDEGLTLADLFGTIEAFSRELFGDATLRTRFRPDFFPYTEPSAELAVSCPFCGGDGCRVCSRSGWIELGGCGMVDPKVFEHVGIDPERYTGFAFGFGLERLAMVRYDIDEIRTFFDNDVRFLEQY